MPKEPFIFLVLYFINSVSSYSFQKYVCVIHLDKEVCNTLFCAFFVNVAHTCRNYFLNASQKCFHILFYYTLRLSRICCQYQMSINVIGNFEKTEILSLKCRQTNLTAQVLIFEIQFDSCLACLSTQNQLRHYSLYS